MKRIIEKPDKTILVPKKDRISLSLRKSLLKIPKKILKYQKALRETSKISFENRETKFLIKWPLKNKKG